jgi:phosphopantothenoylcysteine decarboxylase/phosphopantothenate--cysteine ligase
MMDACASVFPMMDGLIMTAAVADYKPKEYHSSKIKKTDNDMSIELVKNPDILKTLSLSKKQNQFCVGFALETNNIEAYAQKKLIEKNLDAIVLNTVSKETGFQSNTNQVKIFGKNNQTLETAIQSKEEIAVIILDTLNSWIFE